MLEGRSVVIVEAEFIIAMSMQLLLQQLGTDDVEIIPDPRRAADARPDLALIEIELHKPEALELARKLAAAGVKLIGISADSRLENGVDGLADVQVLIKPVPDEALEAAVRHLYS